MGTDLLMQQATSQKTVRNKEKLVFAFGLRTRKLSM